MSSKYSLSYLPVFEDDMMAVYDYIANTLRNPDAAYNLLEETQKAILKRLDNPLISKPYHSLKDRRQPYYTIYVKNYIVFYVVIGDLMEVRRFIYAKRNLREIV